MKSIIAIRRAEKVWRLNLETSDNFKEMICGEFSVYSHSSDDAIEGIKGEVYWFSVASFEHRIKQYYDQNIKGEDLVIVFRVTPEHADETDTERGVKEALFKILKTRGKRL